MISVVRGLFWLASFPGYFPCIYCIYPLAPPQTCTDAWAM
jgi:hypothetical protein